MKLNKVLSMVMVVLMLVCVSTNIFAVNIDNIISTKPMTNVTTGMTSIGSTIFTLITNAAMIIAVVVIAILGVKYMMGSTEEKAEYKKSMMPYVIGAALVFGASTIAKIVTNITF